MTCICDIVCLTLGQRSLPHSCVLLQCMKAISILFNNHQYQADLKQTKCVFRGFFMSVARLLHPFITEFFKQCIFTNRAVNQKRSTTKMLIFLGFHLSAARVVWLCLQKCVFVFLYACSHASAPVKTQACVCKGLCVPPHVCMAECVFLGVFSGRELSGMMTDVTLIMHTPTHK